LVVPPTILADSVSPERELADWLFYDNRFPRARRLALRLAAESSGATALTPVQSDITGIWNAGLGRACGHSRLTLLGVTTESFHFCLKIMMGERARMETEVTRIDRDLFLWQIHSLQAINREHAV
jgi:hypothetical protein